MVTMARQTSVNMTDVARMAGVSSATVSRALRGVPGVSEPLRTRIKQLAEELSYVVSPDASRLSGGGTARVAVVVRSVQLWYFATMLSAIERVLRASDIDVLLYQHDESQSHRDFFERLPARRKVDAVVVVAVPLPESDARRLDQLGVSVVLAGATSADYPYVCIDDAEVGRQATRHLVDLGHKRIAMIRSSDLDGEVWSADIERSTAYRETLDEAGLRFDPDLLVTVPWGSNGGARAMEELLSRKRPPTAVFAYSDEIAIGALRTLRRSHIKVPERMSIIGVDDHPMAELTDLTTVRQRVGRQGEAAARMVVDLLEGRAPAHTSEVIATHVVIRNSTAPAPARIIVRSV